MLVIILFFVLPPPSFYNTVIPINAPSKATLTKHTPRLEKTGERGPALGTDMQHDWQASKYVSLSWLDGCWCSTSFVFVLFAEHGVPQKLELLLWLDILLKLLKTKYYKMFIYKNHRFYILFFPITNTGKKKWIQVGIKVISLSNINFNDSRYYDLV